MRWDGLFADLEAQADALQLAERDAEIDDRSRYEAGRLAMPDRLRAAIGSAVRVGCTGGLIVAGILHRVHPEWVLIVEAGGQEALVPLSAVETLAGLGRLSTVAAGSTAVVDRLGLRYALRTVARDRSGVRVHLRDGSARNGTIDRVGADFIELAAHPVGEQRRRSAVQEVLVIAMSAVAAVRRDA